MPERRVFHDQMSPGAVLGPWDRAVSKIDTVSGEVRPEANKQLELNMADDSECLEEQSSGKGTRERAP